MGLDLDGQSSRVTSEQLTGVGGTSTVDYAYHSNTYEFASAECGVTTTRYYWATGRLTNAVAVTPAGPHSFVYSYVPGSDLLSEVDADSGLLTVDREYDALGRLLSMTNAVNSTAASSYEYTLDENGRRTARTELDSTLYDYSYDSYDQLIKATRSDSPNSAADAAYQYAYRYDEIGNRLHEDRGQLYLDGSFNALNQLTSRAFSGKIDVCGTTSGTNVMVRGRSATLYADASATNWLAGAAFQVGSNTIPVVTTGVAGTNETNIVVFLPPANPQAFGYDANGNLTNDSLRTYEWDEENRLAAVETVAGISGLARHRSEYLYDAQSRRIRSTDLSGWNGSTYATSVVSRYIYHGWNLLAERTSGDAPSATNFYAWGQDLSGTLQGAGGIGGLLVAHLNGTNVFYSYDANGCVTSLTDTNGSSVATYVYGPFGQTVSSSGALADENPFRFSTKYTDDETDLLYYGFRFYQPETGRWPSRDPIGELGGANLYGFVGNNALSRADFIGLSTVSVSITGEIRASLVSPTHKGKAGAPDLGSKVTVLWRPEEDAEHNQLPCDCEELWFGQIAKQLHKRIAMTTVKKDWHIDPSSGAYAEHPFYGPEPKFTIPWRASAPTAYGTLYDDPGGLWWATKYLLQEFETCAVCTRGGDAGTVYGCVTWSHEIKRGKGLIKPK